MILEGLITTRGADGSPHLAPMGPEVHSPGFDHFVLKPFKTSQTYRNLRHHGEGVLHVTDDVLLIAQAAIGIAAMPAYHAAESVQGFVLDDCCHAYEFRIVDLDDSQPRVRLEAVVVHSTLVREFFGFNRAKHAVLEAAILATRLHLIDHTEIEAEYRKLRIIVQKTGGERELAAMALLEGRINESCTESSE